MALNLPYRQHNYMGAFVDDAAVLAFIQLNKWDSLKTGLGVPEEGMFYTNTTGHNFKFYNGGAWINLVGAGGVTLDVAYDAGGAGIGRAVTVDSGAITFTVPDTSNNAALEITQNDTTNNPVAMTITNAGTSASLNLAGAVRKIASDAGALTLETTTSGDLTLGAAGSIWTAAVANITQYINVNDAGAHAISIWAVNAGAGTAELELYADDSVKLHSNAADLLLDSATVLEINSSGGVISIGNDNVAQSINIGGAGARTLSIGSATAAAINLDSILLSLDSTDTTNITMTANAAGAKTFTFGVLNAGAGAADLDINIKSALTIDSGATFSIDGVGASNVTATTGDLTLSTSGSGVLYLTSAGYLALSDGYKAASTYGTDLFLSDAALEWSLFDTNFGEVSVINAINQCSPAAAGFVAAENMDIDIGTSPETVDTFTTATLGGVTPVSGHASWEWFAVGMAESTGHISGGRVSVSWDGDLTPHVNVVRDWSDGGEITFDVTLSNPGTDRVIVTLKATTSVDNYAVKVLRLPYMTAAAVV